MARLMAEQFDELYSDHLLDAMLFGIGAAKFQIEPVNSSIELQGRLMTLRDGTYSNVASPVDAGSALTAEKLEALVKQVETECGPIPKEQIPPWDYRYIVRERL